MVTFNDLEWRVSKEDFPVSIKFDCCSLGDTAIFTFGVPYEPVHKLYHLVPSLVMIHSIRVCVVSLSDSEKQSLIDMVERGRLRAFERAELLFGNYVDSEGLHPISGLVDRLSSLG